MRQMTLKELQDCELNILKSFRDFCDSHNLRYYLCGGTLIGAIRHEGFIPWDDDIDVMMPRPDYMRFIYLNRKGFLSDNIQLDNLYLNENAISSILRLYDTRTTVDFSNIRGNRNFGCWIDIFPLDGLYSSNRKRQLQFRLVRAVQDLQILNDTKLGGKRRNKIATSLQYLLLPIVPLVHLVGHERFITAIDSIARTKPYQFSEVVGVIGGRGVEKEAMIKDELEPAKIVTFEGEKFTCMANYDKYLTNLYGDYMTPPAADEQVSRHEIKFYWK